MFGAGRFAGVRRAEASFEGVAAAFVSAQTRGLSHRYRQNAVPPVVEECLGRRRNSEGESK
jgi:hypothetical protein